MTEVFIIASSALCLAVGLGFCWPPIERYRRSATVGAFGSLLVICGVVLMTTFKWTEVAIKISGLEVKLAEALSENTRYQLALAERDSELNRVLSAASTERQAKSVDAFLSGLYEKANQPVDYVVSKDIIEALQDSGLKMIPSDAIPAQAVAHDNQQRQIGG